MKLESRDLPEYREVSKEELEEVVGGIDTVPVPERPSFLTRFPSVPLVHSIIDTNT